MHLPGRTDSNKTFKTLKSWIAECSASHTACHRDLSAAGQSPKRLLDLANGRVVLRENIATPRYACLSHCWGNPDHIIKTTSKTIDGFMSEVPWAWLTKTFQDAITVCRELDTQYIWIDSLCIIQDSSDDWLDQAAKMAGIYEHAYFTIAATRAAESLEGCFSRTDSRYLSSELTAHPGVYVRQVPPRWPVSWIDRDGSKAHPLLDRGWVYQEMRLSPRVLHFCADEVVWECRSKVLSESMIGDRNLEADQSLYEGESYDFVPYWVLERTPKLLWHRTVQDYSRLKLTFQKDKMIALGALTQKMTELRVNDRFLAGLWENTLLFDLLWMVWPAPTGAPSNEPERPLFPTWSWANVPSQVIWRKNLDATIASTQVQEIDYQATGPPNLGLTSVAKITMSTPLLEAQRVFSRTLRHESDRKAGKTYYGNLRNASDESEQVRVVDFMDCFKRLPAPEDLALDSLLDEIMVLIYVGDSSTRLEPFADEDAVKTEEGTYFIPVGHDSTNTIITGLHVHRMEGIGGFERVGFMEIHHFMDRELRDHVYVMAHDGEARRALNALIAARMDAILSRLPICSVTLV